MAPISRRKNGRIGRTAPLLAADDDYYQQNQPPIELLWRSRFGRREGTRLEAHLTPLPLRADGFGSGETIINLFEKANLSTFLHETGHYFLAVTEALASSQKATPEIHSMLEAVQTWWRDNAADVAKDASSGVSVSDVQIYFNEGTTGNSDKDAAIETGKHEQFAKRAL